MTRSGDNAPGFGRSVVPFTKTFSTNTLGGERWAAGWCRAKRTKPRIVPKQTRPSWLRIGTIDVQLADDMPS